MKWHHTDYIACKAHVALPLQKDIRWRSRRNHRASQMRCVQIGESRRQVSSWQLHYKERLFAAREVHGAVIPGQTSFLAPTPPPKDVPQAQGVQSCPIWSPHWVKVSNMNFNANSVPRGFQQSISNMFAVHLVTFLHRRMSLVQSMLGKELIPLCGSLLSWEHCHSAIPPHLILGVMPSEPGPQPAAPAWVPCSALLMGLIPDLTDHLQYKRITVYRTIQPCFVLSLTTGRALVALQGTCTEGSEQQHHIYRACFGLPQLSPTQSAHLPWPTTVLPPSNTSPRSPQFVSGRAGRAGIWWLPAWRGPWLRKPGAPTQQKWGLVPSSRAANLPYRTDLNKSLDGSSSPRKIVPKNAFCCRVSPEILSHFPVSTLPASPTPWVKLVRVEKGVFES